MKRTLFYICTAILLGLCNACDIISENDRIREGEMITYSRYVLVEDYTGQLCVNCPRGAEILNQLKTTTDGHVITVAIHGNRLQSSHFNPNNETDAIAYAARNSISSYPTAVINRMEKETQTSLWEAAVMRQFGTDAPFDMEVTAEYDPLTKAIHIATSVNTVTDANHNYNLDDGVMLQIWLTQSQIVASQSTPEGTVRDYVHNHVLRKAVNGIDGETLSKTDNDPDDAWKQTVRHSIVPDEAWVSESRHFGIVAFVYQNGNGVLQCCETEIELSDLLPEDPKAENE